jgi:RHS repeat-associated protein
VDGTVADDYTYDTWGRMTQAVPASGTITYYVDPLNRTLVRTDGSGTTTSAYIGTGEQLASSITGSTTTSFAWTAGAPFAQKVGSSGSVRYILSNLHSDVVGLASSSGSVVGTQGYGAWGDVRSGDVSGEQSLLGYQGDPTDSSTGLVDMVTRNYDPSLGRFTTQDVLPGDQMNPTSLNQFIYGNDDPISLIDPDGMCPAGYACIDGVYYKIWRSDPHWAQAHSISYDHIWNPPAWQRAEIARLAAPPPPPPPAPPAPAVDVPKPPSGCGFLWHRCIENGVASGLKTVARAALDVAALSPYALYYVSYEAARGINAVGGRLGWPGRLVALGLALPLAANEVMGLGGDVAIDWLKGVTVNHEPIGDEGRPGYINPLHSFMPAWARGPQWYLPGLHPNGQIDLEW